MISMSGVIRFWASLWSLQVDPMAAMIAAYSTNPGR